MNERIKEKLPNPFRAQGRQISYDGDDKSFCDLYNKEQMIEFAELIIRECVSLFDGSKEIKTTVLLSHNQVIKQIKEHFGVEE